MLKTSRVKLTDTIDRGENDMCSALWHGTKYIIINGAQVKNMNSPHHTLPYPIRQAQHYPIRIGWKKYSQGRGM